MNKLCSQRDDYRDITELLRYLDNDAPLDKEVIQETYRKLFNRHMPKRLNNRVIEILTNTRANTRLIGGRR